MDIYSTLLSLLIGSFFIWLLAGYPIAWVLGGSESLTGFVTWALYENYGSEVAPRLNDKSLAIMAKNVGKLLSSDVLVAIPLFIFMGLMLDKSGLAERMMQSMQLFFGRLRGGLALTVVLIGVILAASTGIVGASVVLLGLLALPIMLQQGYSKSLATGTHLRLWYDGYFDAAIGYAGGDG